MTNRDTPEDSTDTEQSSVARRGFLRAGAGAITAAVAVPAVSSVAAAHFHGGGKPALEIDIKPDSDENTINPKSKGVVPVAVLQTDEFDPTSENVNYRFGAEGVVADGGGARPLHGGHVEDVDGDGRQDLILHFSTEGTGFNGDEEEGHLHWEKGQKGAHHGLGGSDDVRIVGNGR